ncbi:MAG: NAD(P)H-binding protein, partial [Planctomycetes bacterium]|nr:NAD(P)H-binding protein [Planctomycetota bacterium]
MQSHDGRRVLLTGATGYVGGRLRLALEEAGCNLRCMARWPANLKDRVRASTEVVKGDVFEPESLASALQGVHTAYYLIHSMGSSGDFESQDLIGATNFATAAKAAGVQRIVYLGGLGDDQADLSPHLRSRQQVGRVLRDSGVPTIELRASIVIGSGSLSFEMVRALVDRLPVMITPRWTTVMAQPIGIRDLISYLVACLELEVDHSRIYEVGGADRVSYHLLMKEYARQRGLRRWMIRVPFMTPGLSSRWLGFVTPIYARVGRKLIDS